MPCAKNGPHAHAGELFLVFLAEYCRHARVLAAATGLCFLLRLLDDSDVYVALIFELAVVLVSRFTSGYFYGLLASVVGVIGVNYIFTYPYFAFNFTISGYPLTFLVMLAVSIVVSALTTRSSSRRSSAPRLRRRRCAAICSAPSRMISARP